MKKYVALIALCVALAACHKEEAKPADTQPAVSETAPSDASSANPSQTAETTAPVAATTPADANATPAATTAAVPAECETYFKRAQACFEKAGANGAMMKTAFDQSREQMSKVPADQMAAACKMANDQFAQTAAALKCE